MLGAVSNTSIAFDTPPHLGGTAFGIPLALALGVGRLASGTVGFLGDRFGLPAAFTTPWRATVGNTAPVYWFGRVVGTWPQAPVAAETTPLARSTPRDC